ncbi:hypothetical protein GGD81_004401 [Rhodobium orientis]|uniref:Uncharacterized protein n=1 Tax=Rhodobium orientis TaxID=34017 RepID=A0A327JIJ0_9HYPH|nr:hypothetical protein [Rhodobium orientis]MBB4305326.1 hypothetical protein [Rhodobium orientis]MBK5949921.1 hypothetical protein [Rhodobium orientis]RAI25536.1 hypothetical protein CH339_17630 [Rhodobium orientis]
MRTFGKIVTAFVFATAAIGATAPASAAMGSLGSAVKTAAAAGETETLTTKVGYWRKHRRLRRERGARRYTFARRYRTARRHRHFGRHHEGRRFRQARRSRDHRYHNGPRYKRHRTGTAANTALVTKYYTYIDRYAD